jgi:AraC-like DNA-binding protein
VNLKSVFDRKNQFDAILAHIHPRYYLNSGDTVLYLVGMRPQARRDELAMRGNARLFDAVTFARLSRARDYLGACYRGRVPLENAAREACLSPFHFNRVFARAFGETPHEFVTRMRIEEARKMLLAENQSVTDICFDLGYESLGSFSTRFRSLTGLSPAAFRREARVAFGGFASHWPLYYIPACYQRFFIESLR